MLCGRERTGEKTTGNADRNQSVYLYCAGFPTLSRNDKKFMARQTAKIWKTVKCRCFIPHTTQVEKAAGPGFTSHTYFFICGVPWGYNWEHKVSPPHKSPEETSRNQQRPKETDRDTAHCHTLQILRARWFRNPRLRLIPKRVLQLEAKQCDTTRWHFSVLNLSDSLNVI